jgi:3-deoxy-D-manno-octulosonic-acid transferase
MALFVYNIALLLFKVAVWIASWFNPKARAWMVGRRGWRRALAAGAKTGKPSVWMHCASLGEFEQGRPVLEAIRAEYPDYRIVLSFFSPSGYTIRKNYPGADVVCYLPRDTARNAAEFIHEVNPRLILYVKYDLWYHYIEEAHRRGIPMLLISAVFKPHFIFFRSYGSLFVQMLHRMQHIFVQTEADAQLLAEKLKLHQQVEVGGDNRYDRVLAIRAENNRIPAIESWLNGRRALVAGSTWEKDEKYLSESLAELPDDFALIIAPHEIHEASLARIQALFPDQVRFSQLGQQEDADTKSVLVIDNIGMLSTLYRYASVAWVGGGYEAGGIHNTLEPAVYGIPVMFGTNYHKFHEAVQLADLGVAFPIQNAPYAKQAFADLFHRHRGVEGEIRQKLERFIQQQAGATNRIMHHIRQAGYLNG